MRAPSGGFEFWIARGDFYSVNTAKFGKILRRVLLEAMAHIYL